MFDHTHPLATATCAGLQQNWVADPACRSLKFCSLGGGHPGAAITDNLRGIRLAQAFEFLAGNHWNSGLAHQYSCSHLVAHRIDGLRWGSYPYQPGRDDVPGEIGAL